MNDPGDLGRLHDIVAPSNIPFWPLAPGAWIILAVVAAIVLIESWRAWRRYRANAYRRAALRELDGLAALDGDRILEVSSILKRVAVVSYPRDRVASLTGPAWRTFVAERAGRGADVSTLAGELADALKPEGEGSAEPAVIAQAKAWVRSHQAEAEG